MQLLTIGDRMLGLIRLAAAASLLILLLGCASWKSADDPIHPGSERAVPPAAAILAPNVEPTGQNVIARYGGDVSELGKVQAVTPIISLMSVTPQYGPPGVARPHAGFEAYPPPPPSSAQSPHEPYSSAAERAIVGGVIGGIIGAQIGSGSGRYVGAGVGAAVGSMIGLSASNNPCATPHGGTLAGAAAGGVLGYQIGSGSGRSAATALGAMIGAIAGTHAGSDAPGCR